MKLIYEKLTLGSDEGFTFKEIRTRDFACPWHFHAEAELILTLEFDGYRMVGDNLTPIAPGDLVLLGPNLPHIWQQDPRRGRAPSRTRILLVQFEEDFLGDAFWRIPVTHPLQQLLKRAALGLRFTGRTRERIGKWMLEMRECSGLRRMALFLNVLVALTVSAECHAIASPGYTAELNPFNQDRMDRVFRHINEHFDQPLRLADVARQAGLSEGAFSRFFRLHSGRTFPEFVNQLRVARACRLLAQSDLKIADIAFACGFSNLANFNRQFLRLKHTRPTDFRRRLTTPF
jgi:AraC-like DNA-binding protein